MLDIGWTELLVIAVVLIVVVGPKDLPPMLRAFGKMTSNLRKMAGDFRTQFDEALREADMDGVRQTIDDAKRFHPANAIREAINPLREMGNEIRNDLQKATEVPRTGDADALPVASAVEDLIPAPAFSLPDTPPVATQASTPLPPAVQQPAAQLPGSGGVQSAAGSPQPVVATSAVTSQTPTAAPVPAAKITDATPKAGSEVAPSPAKPARSRKPAAAKLAAPAVPAVVSVDGADTLPVKKTRARKPVADEASVNVASTVNSVVKKKAAAKKSATTDNAVAEQPSTPAPRKKKTPVSKDQA